MGKRDTGGSVNEKEIFIYLERDLELICQYLCYGETFDGYVFFSSSEHPVI